jgi:hypothetical protein
MVDSADQSIARARRVGAAFKEQIAALSAASRMAAKQADELETRRKDMRGDSFLHLASLITEGLHSSALDVDRLLEHDLPEETWKRYHAGDHSVFTRRLLSNADAARIQARFRSDPEFRKYVERYIGEFERLLNQAKENEHDDILSAAFLTADVGKLYVLLARALGRV